MSIREVGLGTNVQFGYSVGNKDYNWKSSTQVRDISAEGIL